MSEADFGTSTDDLVVEEDDQRLDAAARYRRDHPGGRPRESSWTAGVEFAAIMMLVLGAIHAVEGFAALFREDYYAVASDELLLDIGYTAWGWIQLGIGVLSVAGGIALTAGRTWARVVAVTFAGTSLLVTLAFADAQPVWSAVLIAIDVVVIYAVVAHGRDLAH
jgi:hypothetical protein